MSTLNKIAEAIADYKELALIEQVEIESLMSGGAMMYSDDDIDWTGTPFELPPLDELCEGIHEFDFNF